MDLFEYQGKEFFAEYGMPVSPGKIAFSVDEAVAAAEELGTPVMVKAQVHTCLLYTSPSPRDATLSRMPSSA